MIHYLPTLNAIFNTLTLVLLLIGLYSIKQDKRERHRNLMIAALVFSTLFLASYLTYHAHFGHKVFPPLGWIKTLYLSILVPHIILAVLMVPFILLTFYFALTKQWERHARMARLTFPIWVFVSITGIVIYIFLQLFYF